MDINHVQDELRRLEGDVVVAERRLAELEAAVAEMKREKLDATEKKAELEAMRESQRLRQHRLRLLSLLQR
ncbi:hypothetical protein XH97_34120 [Bradyrhizobium sp. CCBAU 53380]|nr:hypothetical protein [Bradyrhizobium sp. CCBAU 53380]